VKRGQDASDWSVSAAKGGGAMQSNLKELGVWAASTSGSALLSEETATLRTKVDVVQDGLTYGLGLMKVGDFFGHQGEIFGWEAFALHDPVKGRTVAIATNACGVGGQMYGFLLAVFPDAKVGDALTAKPDK
jgi:D-alanyl-D-alanine carboxypeptidase